MALACGNDLYSKYVYEVSQFVGSNLMHESLISRGVHFPGFYPVWGGGRGQGAGGKRPPQTPPNIQASPPVSVACMLAVT